MNHADVEELLAPYALDAVEPAEAATVEEHLAECARCRLEVARHRELAAMFSSSPEPPPADLWERISGALSEPDPAFAEAPPQRVGDAVTVAITTASRARRRAVFAGVGAAITAVAAAAVLVLAIQVSHLDGRVGKLESSLGSTGLAPAVSAALVGPHRDAVLTSATSSRSAEVVITSSGEAYWVKSSLPRLGATRTYQLWALVHGRPVSVALIGPDPSRYAAFRVGVGATALMVTAEPAGGTPLPTTGVIVQRTLRA